MVGLPAVALCLAGAFVVLKIACPSGLLPERKSFRLGFVFALVSAISVAGCASRAPTYVRAPVYQPPSYGHVPARVAGYRHEGRVVIEDDGMETQAPPPLSRKIEPDDPSEPFSPNYGRFTALKRAAATSVQV